MAFPFKIGNVALDGRSTLPALKYQGASVSVESVDGSSTGRNQSGTMIRDMIATKIKWQLEFVPCTQAQLSALLQAVSGASFSFTYPDPRKSSGTTTGTFYVGSRTAPVWITTKDGSGVSNGVGLWGNVTMNFIEL